MESLYKFHSPATIQTYFGVDQKVGDRLQKDRSFPTSEEVHPFTINIGGRGSSKSYTALGTLMAFLMAHPGCEALIVRKHWNELHRSIIVDLKRVCRVFVGADGPDDSSKDHLIPLILEGPFRKEGYYEARVLTAGQQSILTIKPEPEKASEREIEDAFKGPQYGIVLLDELTQLKPITLSTLQDNLRSPVVKHPRLIACTNPPLRNHWVWHLSNECVESELRGLKPKFNVIRSHMDDNPFLPSGYKERMKEKYRDDPVRYAMYIEGQDGIDLSGTPVFKNAFHLERNVSELVFSPTSPLYVSMDFGWTMNAAVFGQITDRGYLNVLGEIMLEHSTLKEFVTEIRAYIQRRFKHAHDVEYFGDPNTAVQTNMAVGQTTAGILRRESGIHLKWTKRSVEHGLDLLKTLMTDHGVEGTRPRLQIDARGCPELRMGLMGGYVWRETGGVVKPVPLKDGHFDHIMDAMRYLTDNLFGTKSKKRTRKRNIIAGGMNPRRR